MQRGDKRPQMTGQLELALEPRGEVPTARRSGEASSRTHAPRPLGTKDLMETVLSRPNLLQALKRVRQNKGSAGVDGMQVNELPAYLKTEWPRIAAELRAGSYVPKPVRRHEIPKGNGEMRMLGIPTALDRFIQQAVLQVLQPLFDPEFSNSSYGFRPGRSALQAIAAARRLVEDGRTWVVDVDLEKFFDRVNHDVLMGKLEARIADRRLHRLIRSYLAAGVMADGVVTERHEGTPQGGPLSPLLANVLLDEVDKELENRGHRFVRYADDCNVYVRSKRAAERLLEALRGLYGKLRLRINESKSAAAEVWERKFLGYAFTRDRRGAVRLTAAERSKQKLKEKVREITRRTGGRSLEQVTEQLRPLINGWKQYFRLVDSERVFDSLDSWIRRRLRALMLKHWRTPTRAYRALQEMGARTLSSLSIAKHAGRWWRTSGQLMSTAVPNRFFDERGLPRLVA